MIQRDLEIPIPKYFISECAKTLKERDKMLSSVVARKSSQVDEDVSGHG